MFKDKNKFRRFVLRALFLGTFFAASMSLVDYYLDEPFNIVRFLFLAAFFGILNAAFQVYILDRNKSKADQDLNS